MDSIHPKHAADLRALALSPYALPENQQHTLLRIPQQSGQEEEEYEWAYSPLSSPQLTPTPAKGDEQMDAFPFPSTLSQSASSSSFDSERDDYFSSPTSSASSTSSAPSDGSFKADFPSPSIMPPPLLRTSSCRYASFPSGPAAVMMDDRKHGGTGMVRSYSNPVPSLQMSQKLASAYAQEAVELKRNQSSPHLHTLTRTTDSIPRTLSSGSVSASALRSNTSASLFRQRPQPLTPIEPDSPQRGASRPPLGRFFSLPSVMVD